MPKNESRAGGRREVQDEQAVFAEVVGIAGSGGIVMQAAQAFADAGVGAGGFATAIHLAKAGKSGRSGDAPASPKAPSDKK